MAIKAEWAYDFSCSQSLETICNIFNEAGPWNWQLRDNYIFGNYINTRPGEGLHFKVNEYPQAFFKGPREEGFTALLRIESNSQLERKEVDAVFRKLLEKIRAADIADIEPYD